MRTSGTVKSFDADTGEGVVVSDGGCQAVLSWDALDEAGYGEVEPGDALVYEVALVDGMLTVTQIYEIAGEPVDADEDDDEEDDGRDPIKRPTRLAIRLSGLQIRRLLSKCGPAPNPVRRLPASGGTVVVGEPEEAGAKAGLRPATCKWFSRPKGYGFLAPDDGGEDIFVHMDALRRSGVRKLKPG